MIPIIIPGGLILRTSVGDIQRDRQVRVDYTIKRRMACYALFACVHGVDFFVGVGALILEDYIHMDRH